MASKYSRKRRDPHPHLLPQGEGTLSSSLGERNLRYVRATGRAFLSPWERRTRSASEGAGDGVLGVRFEFFRDAAVQSPRMRWGRGIFLLAIAFAGASSGQAAPGYSVEIDLEQQTAYLIRGRRIVLASPISSGRAGHFTETGSFKITEKERNTFLVALWQDCRRARAHGGGGRRRGHARAPRREIHPGADELLHAVRRGDGNACRLFAGLSRFAWLRAAAGEKRHCLLQCG